jgi:four helix bundle protein
MPTELEDLKILQSAENIADSIWKHVVGWDEFEKDVVGKQLARATDSIGANIAESYGRFNYGEKLQFLYYSRGSLFETKYWLNRAVSRQLMQANEVKDYAARLSEVARQLNTFADSLKAQRKASKSQSRSLLEPSAEYLVGGQTESMSQLFTDSELNWLETESPVSNL